MFCIWLPPTSLLVPFRSLLWIEGKILYKNANVSFKAMYLVLINFRKAKYIFTMSVAAMEKNLFNLKFASKELERNSKKCDKVTLPYHLYISA